MDETDFPCPAALARSNGPLTKPKYSGISFESEIWLLRMTAVPGGEGFVPRPLNFSKRRKERQRAVLPLLCGLSLWVIGSQARADIDFFQITNLTGSSGVQHVPYTASDFPVATAVTWTSLSLDLIFADNTVVNFPLYDSSQVSQTTLAAGGILSTASFDTSLFADHGGLSTERFDFFFPANMLEIYTVPLPGTTTGPSYNYDGGYDAFASLTTTGASTDVTVSNSGGPKNVGTFSLLEAPGTGTPEPSSFFLFGMAATGLGVARWRKRKQAA